MDVNTTTEQHTLDTETAYCWRCSRWTVLRRVVAVVDTATLRVIERNTSATCTRCGHLD